MALNSAPITNALQRMMDYLGARQSVINRNIANANTPGYRAQDVERPDFFSQVEKLTQPVFRTDSQHSEGSKISSPYKIKENKDAIASPSGNTVSLQEQMISLSNIRLEHQEALSVYRKIQDMFRVALGSPSS
jgi:flagellar basal-body rod protein FlgB